MVNHGLLKANFRYNKDRNGVKHQLPSNRASISHRTAIQSPIMEPVEPAYQKVFDPNLPIHKHYIPKKLVKDESKLDNAIIGLFGAWDFSFVNRYDAKEEMITVETNDDQSINVKEYLQKLGVLEQD
ncbi:uncharacterized protein BKA55DRAFT_564078 [Fusarium redolens]|jgi:hypothetical protein|uniref:Uncharacterized protein n=1 Tax=Fusarium redolens TaxID=48865 RepID=A0A9P9KFJ4_FUSRE|nr:uncharacterized protein BKA55DRAFT_564078 [Fusarium redolens]KAH7255431.1 hypothetical protein BKA55DRAFT_564078 [Fusarium redolens]